MDLLALADWAWLLGLLGLAACAAAPVWLRGGPAGIAGVEQLGDRIRRGCVRVLGRASVALAAACAAGAVLIGVLASAHRLALILAFAAGAALSAVAGWLGVLAATRANVRSAAAAHRQDPAAALAVALRGGAVGGLAVASAALAGVGLLYWALGSTAVAAPDRERFARAVVALALGASTAALLARVAGGAFAKGADLAAREVAGGDGRSPVTLADQVGDHVGDVVGMGADLLESNVAAIAACVVVASAGATGAALAPAAALAVLASAIGLIASLLGVALAPALARTASGALRSAGAIATVLFVAATFPAARALAVESAAGAVFAWWAPWAALAVGSAAGLLVAWTTEYHTAARPLRRVADAARAGPAAALLLGAAVGLGSAVLPGLVLAGTVWAATSLAGLYGLALAALGLVAVAGVTQTGSAYGAITDNASAIGALSGLPRDARATADSLGALGNTSAGVGKGVATAGAVLSALALLGAFAVSSGAAVAGTGAAGPALLGGLLGGAMLPFLSASLALAGAVRASARVVRALRAEAIPEPDDARCLDLLGRSALRETVAPASAALLAAPLVGAVAGASGVVGLVLGAAATGGVLALFLANSGGLWDNAARFIAGGAHGGRGSPAHRAAAVAETLGDPLKDSCAPALASLIKLVAVMALALAPWLAAG